MPPVSVKQRQRLVYQDQKVCVKLSTECNRQLLNCLWWGYKQDLLVKIHTLSHKQVNTEHRVYVVDYAAIPTQNIYKFLPVRIIPRVESSLHASYVSSRRTVRFQNYAFIYFLFSVERLTLAWCCQLHIKFQDYARSKMLWLSSLYWI